MRPTFVRFWPMLLGLLLTFASVSAAGAHAQLLSTSPARDAVVSHPPEMVQLVFNEPVSALAITLVAPDGTSTDLLPATTSGTAVTIDLPAELGHGTHVLSWRVISVDAHPIAGSLLFSVGAATGTGTAPTGPTDPLVPAVLWVGKALLFAALLFGVGGAVFGRVAPLPPAAQRLAAGLSVVGLLLAPLSGGLNGLDALGLGLAEIADPRAWAVGFATSYGTTVLALVAAFVLAGAALLSPRLELAAWPAWLAGALALALSGHAGSAEPQWLTRPAVVLHLGGLLFWIGALPPLLLLLRDRGPAADFALTRFSRLIPFAVAPILVSGLGLAAIQLGPPAAHWLSPYGLILGGKLALLMCLLALALWNRNGLTRPALAGDGTARRRLRLSVRAEIGLVLLILALVAFWRFTPPPRALAAAAVTAESEPLLLHLMDGNDMAMVSLEPGRPGPVALDIFLTDGLGVPLLAQGVTATLSAPGLGIEPFQAQATETDGVWRIEALQIPVPGTWRLELDIRKSRFSLLRLTSEFDLP